MLVVMDFLSELSPHHLFRLFVLIILESLATIANALQSSALQVM